MSIHGLLYAMPTPPSTPPAHNNGPANGVAVQPTAYNGPANGVTEQPESQPSPATPEITTTVARNILKRKEADHTALTPHMNRLRVRRWSDDANTNLTPDFSRLMKMDTTSKATPPTTPAQKKRRTASPCNVTASNGSNNANGAGFNTPKRSNYTFTVPGAPKKVYYPGHPLYSPMHSSLPSVRSESPEEGKEESKNGMQDSPPKVGRQTAAMDLLTQAEDSPASSPPHTPTSSRISSN